jgi:hypothetical protein
VNTAYQLRDIEQRSHPRPVIPVHQNLYLFETTSKDAVETYEADWRIVFHRSLRASDVAPSALMDSSLARSVTATDVEGRPETRPADGAWTDPEKGAAASSSPEAQRTMTRDSAISRRVLSRFRTADSIPLTPPPDGGTQAWTMALMACLVNTNTWGFVRRDFDAFASPVEATRY